MTGGYQPRGGNTLAPPITGSGVKPADLGAAERDRLARLVEGMIDQAPQSVYGKPAVRMALAIAASAVRRGRHLTDSEKLCNLANAMEEPSTGDTPEDIAESMALAARIRAAAGAA
jgi:hypothetical protein